MAGNWKENGNKSDNRTGIGTGDGDGGGHKSGNGAEAGFRAGLRERKMLETQEKILETAKKVFLKQGFKDTTITLISKEANVGYGTVYNYFNSKEDLLINIVNHIMEEFNEMLFIHYSPAKVMDSEKIIYSQIYRILNLAVEHREILTIFKEAMGYAEKVASHWDCIMLKYIDRIINDIGYSQNKGLAKPLDREIVSKSIVHMVIGFFWDIVQDTESDVETITENITKLYMHGLYYKL